MTDSVEEIADLVDVLIEAEKTGDGPTVFTRWHHAAEYLHAAGYRKVDQSEDQYEYSVQFTIDGRKMVPQGWSGRESAQEWFNSGTGTSGDGEYGPWSKKLVKRRKAGPVEDAT